MLVRHEIPSKQSLQRSSLAKIMDQEDVNQEDGGRLKT
jgi:hypothetical protein